MLAILPDDYLAVGALKRNREGRRSGRRTLNLSFETLHPGFVSDNTAHEFRKTEVRVECRPTETFARRRNFDSAEIVNGRAGNSLSEIGWKNELRTVA
jgi:hypothetical protein